MKKNKDKEIVLLTAYFTMVACFSAIAGYNKTKVYDGKIVEISEIKNQRENYFKFYIDRDGHESSYENILEVSENILTEVSIADQLKKGSQVKYKAGKEAGISLNNILEIDGVKTR